MPVVLPGRSRQISRKVLARAALGCLVPLLFGTASLAQGIDDEPSWAYSIGTPSIAGDSVFNLPGAERSFTFDEIRAVFGPADWYPGDHPTMPDIVANGRFPRVWSCALCHYPNGQGRPENAGISGLPRDYFIQQLYDFRNGLRASAQPRKFSTSTMATTTTAAPNSKLGTADRSFTSFAESSLRRSPLARRDRPVR